MTMHKIDEHEGGYLNRDEHGRIRLLDVFHAVEGSPGEFKNRKPSEWARLRRTRSRANEIDTARQAMGLDIPAIVKRTDGHYACRELVLDYAQWLGGNMLRRMEEFYARKPASLAKRSYPGASADARAQANEQPTSISSEKALAPDAPQGQGLDQVMNFIARAVDLACRSPGASRGFMVQEGLRLAQEMTGIPVFDRLAPGWERLHEGRPVHALPQTRVDPAAVPHMTGADLASHHRLSVQQLNALLERGGVIYRNARREPVLADAWSRIGEMRPYIAPNKHSGYRIFYNDFAHEAVRSLLDEEALV